MQWLKHEIAVTLHTHTEREREKERDQKGSKGVERDRKELFVQGVSSTP